MRQYAFEWPVNPSYAAQDFVVAAGNREAWLYLNRWPDWSYFAAALWGPPGSGKTHLAHIFAQRSQAMIINGNDLAGQGTDLLADDRPVLIIDDADHLPPGRQAEEALLHCHNRIQQRRGYLLICAQHPPSQWTVGLADLSSRLRAMIGLALTAPDDVMIDLILRKVFADRQLQVDDAVLAYLGRRMERSFAAVSQWAALLDRSSLADGRPITVGLVRALLQDDSHE